MRCGRLSSVVALVLSMAVTAAGAEAPATKDSQKQALVSARNELAANASLTKGAARARFDLERRRLDELIRALEHGQPVSQSELDQALEKARTMP